MRFQIDWASLIVGSKFTVFALLYFVFDGNFPSTSSRGGLYLEGRFNGGFLRYPFEGGGGGSLYIEELFSEFYDISVYHFSYSAAKSGQPANRCLTKTNLFFNEDGHLSYIYINNCLIRTDLLIKTNQSIKMTTFLEKIQKRLTNTDSSLRRSPGILQHI